MTYRVGGHSVLPVQKEAHHVDHRHRVRPAHRHRRQLAAVRVLGVRVGGYFPPVRTPSAQLRAALASVGAGFVHFFPRTP